MENSSIIELLFTLVMLILLQAVLGFDNLLYITLESKRAPREKQAMVRQAGIAIAMVFRIVLLILLVNLVSYVDNPLWKPDYPFFKAEFDLHSIIVLLGGVFIIYTATKEILHMMNLEEVGHEEKNSRTTGKAIFWIVIMNLVFSFDSLLSAMALTDVFWVMAISIMIGAGLMIWMADRVAEFLQKNRMYEVLGLFILFVVGIMLLTEGGHHAHLNLFGREVNAMPKTTFYFVIGVLVFIAIVQTRYQRKLQKLRLRRAH